MTNAKQVKRYLLPVFTAAMILGCTTALLPKSDELLATEQYYQKTSTDPNVIQHAAQELDQAGATLQSAKKAKTEEEMENLVYISNNQINLAIEVAKINAARKRVSEIKVLESKLRNRVMKEKRRSISVD